MSKSDCELDSVSDKQNRGGADKSAQSLMREIQILRKDSGGPDSSKSSSDLAAVNQHLHELGLLPSLSIDDNRNKSNAKDKDNKDGEPKNCKHDRSNHDGSNHHDIGSSDRENNGGQSRQHDRHSDDDGHHKRHNGHHKNSLDSLTQQIEDLDQDLSTPDQGKFSQDIDHFNNVLHSLGLPQGFDLEFAKPTAISSGTGNSPVEIQPVSPGSDNPTSPVAPVEPVATPNPVSPVEPVTPVAPLDPPVIQSGPISDLPNDGSLSEVIGNSKAVQLNSGIYTFSNFNQSTHDGVALPGSVQFSGSGIDKTVIEMNKDTSTRAGEVPTIDGTTTNPLYLMKVSGGSPTLSDFTLAGTAQGHLYNGIRMDGTTNAVVKDVKITQIPGNSRVNPGETFAINDYRGNNDHYDGLQIDGEGVGASGFASNSSKNVTVDGSTLTNNKYSAGATFWETQNVTVENTSTSNNRTGLNFERVTGTVNIDNVSFSGNTGHDIGINNDQGSAKVIITNPHLAPGKKLTIYVGETEQGNPNLQKRSDIEVIENGKDVTNQVVDWV